MIIYIVSENQQFVENTWMTAKPHIQQEIVYERDSRGIGYACYGVSLYIYSSSEISSRGKVTILECLYSYIEDATRDGQIMWYKYI